ncbi:hypothetical protein XCR_1259 [Xanthomonas campestris pv. raphani 756C]|nr:hypothetical protein XCR_1259 [Xanthomonas campestris pv. raphani 756C]
MPARDFRIDISAWCLHLPLTMVLAKMAALLHGRCQCVLFQLITFLWRVSRAAPHASLRLSAR